MSNKKFLLFYAVGALVLLLGSATYLISSHDPETRSATDNAAARTVARGSQLRGVPADEPAPEASIAAAPPEAASTSPLPFPPAAAVTQVRPPTSPKGSTPQAPEATVDLSTSNTFGGGQYEGPSAPPPVPRQPTGKPGFEITCAPVVKMALPEGDSDGCSIVSVGGFSGIVALACLDAPAGLDCWTDEHITLAAGATEGFHLSMNNEAPLGTYILRIVGSSGGLSDVVQIEFHSIDHY